MRLATIITMSEEKKKRGRPANQTALRAWVSEKWTGDHVALAAALGVKISYLEKLLNGSLQMSHDLAFKIEEFTKGELTHDMLRPRKSA